MGINISIQKVSACDIKYIQEKCLNKYIIITTIDKGYNIPLIKGTVSPHEEESIINRIIINKDKNIKGIIIYGKNNQDLSVIDKYKQLIHFNVGEIYIYIGGLFEWLLLHKNHPDVFLIDDDNKKYNLWDFYEQPNPTIIQPV